MIFVLQRLLFFPCGNEVDEGADDGNSEGGGHICLIMGDNAEPDEVAISDSWGEKVTERWVPVELTKRMMYSSMTVMEW